MELDITFGSAFRVVVEHIHLHPPLFHLLTTHPLTHTLTTHPLTHTPGAQHYKLHVTTKTERWNRESFAATTDSLWISDKIYSQLG